MAAPRLFTSGGKERDAEPPGFGFFREKGESGRLGGRAGMRCAPKLRENKAFGIQTEAEQRPVGFASPKEPWRSATP